MTTPRRGCAPESAREASASRKRPNSSIARCERDAGFGNGSGPNHLTAESNRRGIRMGPEQFELHQRIEQTHWWFVGRRLIMQQLVHAVVPARAGRLVVD